MTEGLEAVTLSSLSLALDAAALRHQVVANNIANAEAEGYAPMRVKFSESMEDARRVLNEGRRLNAQHIVAWAGEGAALEPVMQAGLPGRNVRWRNIRAYSPCWALLLPSSPLK